MARLPNSITDILKSFILNFASKKKLKEIKTICVGNIYVGGTGKTPLTIKLYHMLRDLNYKVSTVKKFYKNQKIKDFVKHKGNKKAYFK